MPEYSAARQPHPKHNQSTHSLCFGRQRCRADRPIGRGVHGGSLGSETELLPEPLLQSLLTLGWRKGGPSLN